jgi:hypothetical protein
LRTPQAQPYTLKLSEAELVRYRDMAGKAMLAELDTWADGQSRGAYVCLPMYHAVARRRSEV